MPNSMNTKRKAGTSSRGGPSVGNFCVTIYHIREVLPGNFRIEQVNDVQPFCMQMNDVYLRFEDDHFFIGSKDDIAIKYNGTLLTG